MRERGVQSRRVRDGKQAASPPPRPGTTANAWQIIAIVALLAATAGWTTVAVIALREPATAVVASPAPSDDEALIDDEATEVPVADTHDAPDLEAALPATVDGVDLQTQSVTGADLLGEDEWSTTVTTFLTSVGKKPTDLQFAQAYDPTQSLDGSIKAYHVGGVDGAKLRDVMLEAWKTEFPDIKLTDVTLGGQKVIKVEFDDATPTSHLYVQGENVYDIWTDDPELAATAMAALPGAGASAAPGASAGPAASGSPAASQAP